MKGVEIIGLALKTNQPNKMSESHVVYHQAKEWFQRGRNIRKQLEEEEAALLAKEEEWKKERLERRKKIDGLKRNIMDNYGRKALVARHKKTIVSYERKMASEEEMMNKMEYATKCLEFIKQLMIRDAERLCAIIINKGQREEGSDVDGDVLPRLQADLPEPEGLYECEVNDVLSISINKLASYLEGEGEESAPIAIYERGPGKFIRVDWGLYEHGTSVPGQSNVIERNFPSIFDLKHAGLGPDAVIGLAHMQFIGEIRDEDTQPEFEWVNESKEPLEGRYVCGYYGVAFPPEYFLDNHEFVVGHEVMVEEDWRTHIPEDKPAKMYIGNDSRFEYVSSMEDILEDGRLYDNRFGLRYDSTAQKITWQFDWE